MFNIPFVRLDAMSDESVKFSGRERLELYYTSPVIKFFLNTITYLLFLGNYEGVQPIRSLVSCHLTRCSAQSSSFCVNKGGRVGSRFHINFKLVVALLLTRPIHVPTFGGVPIGGPSARRWPFRNMSPGCTTFDYQ